MRRRRNRSRRARRAIDHRHLAEELALAERDDHGLVRAIDLGDFDLAVEHDEQLAPGRSLLENDVADVKFVDAFLDRHCRPSPCWPVAPGRYVSPETPAGK